MIEIKLQKMHLMRPIAIQRQAISMRFKMQATWPHLRCPIAIQRPRLNGDDSHPRVSSEPLMRFIGRLRPNRL